MQLDSVRELKADLLASVITPLQESPVMKSAIGVSARALSTLANVPPTIALGVTQKGQGFALAVRIQKRMLQDSKVVETITKKAKGEVDVRYIGLIQKRSKPPWYQGPVRPLRIGASVGHFKISAGTIGGFVKDRKTGKILILSNNHVLANENRAKAGDAVLQPGAYDGGGESTHRVARLERFVRLNKTKPNRVDCAVAALLDGIAFEPRSLDKLGKLAGVSAMPVQDHEAVAKLGRTTGLTHGKVTAFDIDGVKVQYEVGVLSFDNQIEIEGSGNLPFSQGGDSGSLIVDADNHAVALLFAGGDQGGSNGMGLTYASPIDAVLTSLKVDLVS